MCGNYRQHIQQCLRRISLNPESRRTLSRSKLQIYCQQCSSALCSLQKKCGAFTGAARTQQLRSHHKMLYFKMLVFSSLMMTLVFSTPLKSCCKTGRASHSHSSSSKNSQSCWAPLSLSSLLKPTSDLLVFSGKPHPCGMVPQVAQLTANSFLPHHMKSLPGSSSLFVYFNNMQNAE